MLYRAKNFVILSTDNSRAKEPSSKAREFDIEAAGPALTQTWLSIHGMYIGEKKNEVRTEAYPNTTHYTGIKTRQ